MVEGKGRDPRVGVQATRGPGVWLRDPGAGVQGARGPGVVQGAWRRDPRGTWPSDPGGGACPEFPYARINKLVKTCFTVPRFYHDCAILRNIASSQFLEFYSPG